MPRKRTRRLTTPRQALQVVYDLACEMSHSNSYVELDDEGNILGTDPAILKALRDVKSFFRLRGEP